MYNGALMLLKIKLGGEWIVVGGMRTTKFDISGEMIEANVISDNSWRILAEGGLRQVNINLAGLFSYSESEREICKLAFSGEIREYRLEFANKESLVGKFQIINYNRFGDFDKEEEYSISLSSSSVIEYSSC